MQIWGVIDKAAIVSTVNVFYLLSRPPAISSDHDIFAFKFLKHIWKSYFTRSQLSKKKTTLSHPTGTAVGQFLNLLKLSDQYHEDIISTIIRDFGYKVKSDEIWQKNEDFCRGVQEGLAQEVPEEREFSPFPAMSMTKARTPSPRSDSEQSSVTVQKNSDSSTKAGENLLDKDMIMTTLDNNL